MIAVGWIRGIGLGIQYDDDTENNGTVWILELLILRFIWFPNDYAR